MGLAQPKFGNSNEAENLHLIEVEDGEIISIKECKKYLSKYNLSDQRITKIKDGLIGVVDSIFNSYLEGFK